MKEGNGISITTAVQVVLIILKIFKLITISWVWVLLPFWGTIIFVTALFLIAFFTKK